LQFKYIFENINIELFISNYQNNFSGNKIAIKMQDLSEKAGHIKISKGCMFSGKSTDLYKNIMKLTHEEIQHGLAVIKHSFDNRYSTTSIVTHNGLKYRAVSTNNLSNLLDSIDTLQIKYVFIDEGQFFEHLEMACYKLKQKGCTVMVAGLDMDFNKIPFPSMASLEKIADEVVTLTADCNCGAKAIYSKLLVQKPEEGNVVIGGADKYAPVCSACYDKTQVYV